MKHIVFLLLFGMTVILTRGQSAALSVLNDFGDSTVAVMDNYFREIKQVCAGERAGLWGLDLYGPILLVDPVSRKVFANMPDKEGLLVKDQSIYAGFLPRQISPSNTATEWAGVNGRWSVCRCLVKGTPGSHLFRMSCSTGSRMGWACLQRALTAPTWTAKTEESGSGWSWRH